MWLLPPLRNRGSDFRCLLNYPFLFDTKHVGFLPIATWICPSSADKSAGEASVLIICTNPVIGRLVDSHYSSAYDKRWMRLQENHLWIFFDLLHIFGEWGQVWSTAKSNLMEYQRQIHDSARKMPLLDLARALHDQIANILWAREQLRVHESAITRLLGFTDVTAAQVLTERAQEHLEDITFHEETSQVILRQLENMTSLVWLIQHNSVGCR